MTLSASTEHVEGVVNNIKDSSAIYGVELHLDGDLQVDVDLEGTDETVSASITSLRIVVGVVLRSEVGVLDKDVLILEHTEPAKVVGVLVGVDGGVRRSCIIHELSSSHLSTIGLLVLYDHQTYLLGKVGLVTRQVGTRGSSSDLSVDLDLTDKHQRPMRWLRPDPTVGAKRQSGVATAAAPRLTVVVGSTMAPAGHVVVTTPTAVVVL